MWRVAGVISSFTASFATGLDAAVTLVIILITYVKPNSENTYRFAGIRYVVLITVINARLAHRSFSEQSKHAFNQKLLKELRGLKAALNNHADRTMQRIYP